MEVPFPPSAGADLDDPVHFVLSHCDFREGDYHEQFRAKCTAALANLSSALPVSAEVMSQCVYMQSPTRHFRARCKLSITQEQGGLDWCIWEGPPEARRQEVVHHYPIASAAVNVLMPRLLVHIGSIGGVLRNGLVAASFLTATTGDALVSLIYNSPLSEVEWTVCATELKSRLVADNLAPTVTNINLMARSRKKVAVVGDSYVVERLLLRDGRELIYRQPEGAFSNPNSAVSRSALDWLCDTFRSIRRRGGENLLELYCGNGNHTVCLSPIMHKVVAVELSDALCDAARVNLKLNAISNAEIVNVKAERFAHDVLRGRRYGDVKFDAVLVDPPRCGLDETTLKLVIGYRTIVYISCNPEALVRDLRLMLASRNYKIQNISFMDQFAYTRHLEAGVFLELSD